MTPANENAIRTAWILFAITWAISKYHNTKLVDKAMSKLIAVRMASA
ncbi:TPA: hypothetical protein ACJIWN_002103 [Enterobacter cloacae]|nr:hypothetical protein [Enterobacter cloacae]